MKLNVVLPWFLVLGLGAALASVYVSSSHQKDELARLKAESAELETARASLEETQAAAQRQQAEIASLRKDTQELLRLRNEIGQLRQENQDFSKQAQTAKAQADAASARAADVTKSMGTELARLQSERLAAATASQRDICLNQLRQIDGAKQQWALEHQRPASAIPSPSDLLPYLKDNKLPQCPAGGVYALNAVSRPPTCTMQGHVLAQPE